MGGVSLLACAALCFSMTSKVITSRAGVCALHVPPCSPAGTQHSLPAAACAAPHSGPCQILFDWQRCHLVPQGRVQVTLTTWQPHANRARAPPAPTIAPGWSPAACYRTTQSAPSWAAGIPSTHPSWEP
ncbi:hypothetical protein COO60DRAFT_168986 [Scenedesmus sp. NREL 46B-D3]|nr:hypothetical protein COO60DRAFT_168986 [Scenedesmus sp. NREL 46B-D3]